MKRCTKCKTLKPLGEFQAVNRYRDGRFPWCRECKNYASKIHKREASPEAIKRKQEYQKQWAAENTEKIRLSSAAWRKANPDKRKAQLTRSYNRHREQKLSMSREWKKNNPEKVLECQRRHDRKARGTPRGKLNKVISCAIYKSLKSGKGYRRWEGLVGYTVDQVKAFLEKRFKLGMTWENYGEWHIDHKTPIAAFNFERPEDIDFKRCWALKNLQPMWAKENIIKADKTDRPFQPSLTI